MKLIFSSGISLYFLLTTSVGGHCDEDPGLPTSLDTPESDATSTLSSIDLDAAPGWWVGPGQPAKPLEFERDPENETLDEANEQFMPSPPLIIIKYPFEHLPQISVGSLIPQNETSLCESENGNNTNEEKSDFSDFPLEGINEEQFKTPNSSEVWVDDFFVLPDDNVTEVIENTTDEAETTDFPTENFETTTPNENSLDTTEVGAPTELLEHTTLPSTDIQNMTAT